MTNMQVVLNQTMSSEAVKNVLNWQLPNNSPATLTELADAIRSSMLAQVAPFLADNWSLDSCTMREYDGGAPFTIPVAFTLGPLVGTDNGALMPPANALLISTSYLGPRPNRGRVYFAGITEGNNETSGIISVACLAAFTGLIDGWANGVLLSGGSAFLRIARPNDLLNNWTLDNPVTGVTSKNKWRTMRSRIPND